MARGSGALRDAGEPGSFGPGTVSRDALHSLGYSVMVRAGTLGLTLAAARLGGVREAGALGIALQVTAVACLFATLSLPQAVVQRLAGTEEPAARRRLLVRSAGAITLSAAIVGAALAALAPWVASRLLEDPALSATIRWCSPLVLANSLYLWCEGAFQGGRWFASMARWGGLVTALDLVLALVTAPLGVVAMLAGRTGVRALASGLGARWILERAARASHAGLASHSEREPQLEPRERARALLRFSLPLFLAGAALLVGNLLLRVLLLRRSGLEAAGHFHVADSIAQAVGMVPIAAATAFLPAAARDANEPAEAMARRLHRAMAQVVGVSIPLCLLAMGLAPWVVEHLLGHEFGPARAPFIWLVLGYGCMTPAAIHGAWLTGRGHVSEILAMGACWALVAVTGAALLPASWGANAVAVSAAAAYFLVMWSYAVVIAPRHALPWSSHGFATVVSALSLGAGASLCLLPGVPSLVSLLGVLAIAGAVFARWGFPAAESLVMRGRS